MGLSKDQLKIILFAVFILIIEIVEKLLFFLLSWKISRVKRGCCLIMVKRN